MSENEHRCRVCDGPVETPVQIVCDECKRRDTEEMEREMEFYELFLVTDVGTENRNERIRQIIGTK